MTGFVTRFALQLMSLLGLGDPDLVLSIDAMCEATIPAVKAYTS